MTDLNKERELELFNAFVQKELPELFEKHSNSNFFAKIIYDSMFGAWLGAKAQAVPVWISADFMKPDEGDLVLGISTTKLAKFNVYQVVALDEFDECEINYWMPLPTAPSESGAEG